MGDCTGGVVIDVNGEPGRLMEHERFIADLAWSHVSIRLIECDMSLGLAAITGGDDGGVAPFGGQLPRDMGN